MYRTQTQVYEMADSYNQRTPYYTLGPRKEREAIVYPIVFPWVKYGKEGEFTMKSVYNPWFQDIDGNFFGGSRTNQPCGCLSEEKK
jgi:hypothetical protein